MKSRFPYEKTQKTLNEKHETPEQILEKPGKSNIRKDTYIKPGPTSIFPGLFLRFSIKRFDFSIKASITMSKTRLLFSKHLIFTLLAFFPNIINKLPKSGSWTNTIKVILGFMELALAFKFLSNVDLIQEWGILKREVFIAIWVLIFIACGLYLIITSRKTSYIISSLSFILIALYMGSSLFTKSTNLSLLSGLLPPEFYSIYNDTNNCPLGLDCVKDFNDGLNKSKINNKPILLDFTGWACANCRRVEENTWSVPKVFDLINNEFVLISLYVDDRTNLNGDEIILLRDKNGNEKILDKVGEKWSAFQTLNFQNNSQPYYVLLSPNLDILNKPIQYTDTDTYYDWLIDGLNKFKN